MAKVVDKSLLEMALIGYETERQRIRDKIAEIQAQLNGRSHQITECVASSGAKRARRGMSAAARRRIAAAQKKRWAEYRRKQKIAA